MRVFLGLVGCFLIILSSYVLLKLVSMTVQYRRNLQWHGVKNVPLLRAQFVVGGAWTIALVIGILMVARGLK